MPAQAPSPTPPAAATNPNANSTKRKHKTKAAGSSALNPNWAQLQSKLPRRPAATHLGKRKHGAVAPAPPQQAPEVPSSPTEAEVTLEPTSDATSLTKAMAMDCEMVGVGSDGSKSALGRVTLVNSFGNVVYDKYVRPVERIVDYRTRISGIRPKHMNKAEEFWVVQKEVAELIKGRVLVGHALHNDLKVLLLSHPKKDMRDTAAYFRRERKTPSLKDLAAEVLGAKIQQSEHCPIEDGRASMFIYKKHKKAWEKKMKEEFRFKKQVKKRGRKRSAQSSGSDPNIPTVLL